MKTIRILDTTGENGDQKPIELISFQSPVVRFDTRGLSVRPLESDENRLLRWICDCDGIPSYTHGSMLTIDLGDYTAEVI